VLLAAATLVALALRLAVGLQMTGPLVVPDEIGYLTQARWLVGGEGIPMIDRPYYHIGYALLLTPAAALAADDPALFWRLLTVTNSVVGASMVPLLATLLRRLFGVTPGYAVAAAFVASCYPSYIVPAGQGWAEIAIAPGFLLWVLAVHQLMSRPGLLVAVGVGAATAAVYSLHSRTGLPVLAVTPLLLGWAVKAHQLRPLPALAAAAAAAAFTSGVVALQHRALQALWIEPVSMTSDGLSTLLRWEAVPLVAAQLAGNLWTVVVGTVGLVAIGVAAHLGLLHEGTRERLLGRTAQPTAFSGRRTPRSAQLRAGAARITGVGALLGIAGTWFLAAAFFAGVNASRADQYIYGRYLETVTALPLALGVVVLLAARRPRHVVLVGLLAAALVVSCALTVWAIRGPGLAEDLFLPFNTNGVMLFGLDQGRAHVGTATLVVLAVGALVTLLTCLDRRVGAGVVLAVLLTSTAFVATQWHFYIDQVRYIDWEPPPVPEDALIIAIDDDERRWFEHGVYHFWMPGKEFVRVDLSGPGRPPHRYVFAPLGWPYAQSPGVRELWVNPYHGMGLYEQTRR
jgi:hypothetical protein